MKHRSFSQGNLRVIENKRKYEKIKVWVDILLKDIDIRNCKNKVKVSK